MMDSYREGRNQSHSKKQQLRFFSYQQVEEGDGNAHASEDLSSGQAPRGRWAQRVDNQGVAVKSQDGKTVDLDIATGKRKI